MNLSLPSVWRVAAAAAEAALCFFVLFLVDLLAVAGLRALPSVFLEAVRGRGGVSLVFLDAFLTENRDDFDANAAVVLLACLVAIGDANDNDDDDDACCARPLCNRLLVGVAVKSIRLLNDDEFSFPSEDDEEFERYDGICVLPPVGLVLVADTMGAVGGSKSMLTFRRVMTGFFGMGVLLV